MTSPSHSSGEDFVESLGISLDEVNVASSDLSDEDFLRSLGISLDEVNVAADADTHASVTGIYAQDPHIKLDVGETSVTEIPLEIFDQNNPVGAIIRPSYLGYLRHLDMGRSNHKELLCALAERWWDTHRLSCDLRDPFWHSTSRGIR
ncbi:hypothetical protein JCGZ_14955 [Jatropha curcas]|uniref:Aminotransferase-like plant mobile domain-containing protein n=1 Tax=Jatropha curcas TaxID=180498 RepID=A0A067K847_JATCU|nr:hypothetical protein JCGZ_14955 [Jatropha curcas]